MVEIIDYQDHYLEDFRKLNRDWLEKYNALDDYDLVILNDPQKIILEPGGFIFFAQDTTTGELVGTVSLMKVSTRSFEVTKLCVTENHKKQGIGFQLLNHAIQIAKTTQAKKLTLYTMRQLTPAIKLYKKVGFSEVSLGKGKTYDIADVKMELVL